MEPFSVEKCAEPEIRKETLSPSQRNGSPPTIRSSILTTFLEVTSIHALPDFYQATNRYVRGFWIILLLMFTTVGLWQVGILVVHFASPPHFVGNIEVVIDKDAYFPTVTLCNLNRFLIANNNKSNYNRMNNKQRIELDIALQSFVTITDFSMLEPNYDSDGEYYNNLPDKKNMSVELAWDYLRLNLANFTSNTQFDFEDPSQLMAFFGMSCIELAPICRWRQELYNCCDFMVPVFRKNGLCYEFHVPKDKNGGQNQKIPGADNGLIMSLRILENQYYSSFTSSKSLNNLATGLYMEVGYNQSSTMISKPIGISPGSYNWISMKKRVQEFDSNTFNWPVFTPKCVNPSDRKFKYVNGSYTVNNCAMDCYQELAFELCFCTFLGQTLGQTWKYNNSTLIPHNSRFKTCNPVDIQKCLSQRNKKMSDNLEKCIEKCLPPCERRMSVDYSVTSVPFLLAKTTETYITRYSSKINDSIIINNSLNFMDDIAVVNIFFEDHTFIHTIHQEREDLFELIAEVGGHLGLWLGVSVVSFVQLFYYLVAWLCGVSVNPSNYHQTEGVIFDLDPTQNVVTKQDYELLIQQMCLLQTQVNEMNKLLSETGVGNLNKAESKSNKQKNLPEDLPQKFP